MEGLFLRTKGIEISQYNYSDRYIKEKLPSYYLLENVNHRKKKVSFYERLLRKNCAEGQFEQTKSESQTSLQNIFNPLIPKLANPRPPRKIRSMSCSKSMECPGLIDDFYLNLVDWSCADMVAIAVKSQIYIVSSNLRKIKQIYQVSKNKYIGAINFSNGNKLGVGDSEGKLRILDIEKQTTCLKYENHYGRIGSIQWFDNLIASGSKEGVISISDYRSQKKVLSYSSHSKEICGIKWNPNGTYIASGGNDTILSIFDLKKSLQLVKFSNHCAAVKALDWNPFDSSIIASGGGTSDKKIRFFSIKTLEESYSIDTGTQISNLSFSKISNQMVTTHGYSLNQINVWQTKDEWKSANLLGTLRGHNRRVLYLANSPYGQSIVTGAGDQTIKFWNVFQNDRSGENQLDISSMDLR